MKKNVIYIYSALMLSVFILLPAFSQEDMTVVHSDAFSNQQRPAAVFKHDEHNETAAVDECNECHHVYDESGQLVDDESSEDQPCSDCHGLQATGPKPGLMPAFHANCKGCHLKNRKGPIMCGECHVRRLLAVD